MPTVQSASSTTPSRSVAAPTDTVNDRLPRRAAAVWPEQRPRAGCSCGRAWAAGVPRGRNVVGVLVRIRLAHTDEVTVHQDRRRSPRSLAAGTASTWRGVASGPNGVERVCSGAVRPVAGAHRAGDSRPIRSGEGGRHHYGDHLIPLHLTGALGCGQRNPTGQPSASGRPYATCPGRNTGVSGSGARRRHASGRPRPPADCGPCRAHHRASGRTRKPTSPRRPGRSPP